MSRSIRPRMVFLLTPTELARTFGIDTRTVRYWTEWGCPVARPARGREPPRYDPARVFRWRLAFAESGRRMRPPAARPADQAA